MNNSIHCKLWNKITCPFPNLNGAAVEVWDWISNFIQHLTLRVIDYSCWNKIYVSKRGSWWWKIKLEPYDSMQSIEYRSPTDFIYMYPIFKWVQWLDKYGSGAGIFSQELSPVATPYYNQAIFSNLMRWKTSQVISEIVPLRWRHNDHDSVSNHQPHGCLLNRLFRRRSKKTSKLRVTGLCVGNSPGPVNSPHKGPVTRKMFPFDDVIMTKKLIDSWCPRDLQQSPVIRRFKLTWYSPYVFLTDNDNLHVSLHIHVFGENVCLFSFCCLYLTPHDEYTLKRLIEQPLLVSKIKCQPLYIEHLHNW